MCGAVSVHAAVDLSVVVVCGDCVVVVFVVVDVIAGVVVIVFVVVAVECVGYVDTVV